MLFYRSPKKNSFGHSLKRFSPERQAELAHQFLEDAAFESSLQETTLTIGSPLGSKNKAFQKLTESASKALGEELQWGRGHVTRQLPPDDFERCVRWLMAAAPLPNSMECFVMMARNHRISSWRIEGISMPTESFLNEVYGTLPTVQPMFSFETNQQYDYVKAVASDLGYFTMNDAHLGEG